jgi:methionyl-tRNA formyltransferase
MSQPQAGRPIERIVLLSLDGLYSAIALPILVEQLQGRVVGMCLSRRFGGKYGSWWTQLKKATSRSGWDFVTYTMLQLVLFYPMSALAAGLNRVLGRRRTVYPLRQLARRYGIPVFSTREPNNDAIVGRIRSLKPDLIVVCYFDHIIRRPLIEVARCGVINIHTGLLPAMRGPTPNAWSIIEGCEQVGVTVHYIDAETLDTGPVLKLRAIARDPGESVLSLDCRLVRMGAELALEAIAEIETGSARPVTQDAGAGRYFSYPTRADLRRLRQQGGRLYRMRDFVRPFFAGGHRPHDRPAQDRDAP